MIPAWLMSLTYLLAALAVLWWRRRQPWTAWWVISIPCFWIAFLYWATWLGRFGLANAMTRPDFFRPAFGLLALTILGAVWASSVVEGRR
jgi:hypothetical protein